MKLDPFRRKPKNGLAIYYKGRLVLVADKFTISMNDDTVITIPNPVTEFLKEADHARS